MNDETITQEDRLMIFSEKLKKEATPILEYQFRHPFVKGLGDGSLSLDKFKYYMIQDSLYIVEYARAMTWVAPLLPDVKEIVAMLDAAKASFEIEFMLKEQYFKKFDIRMDDALRTEPAPTCKAYVDHLIRYTRTGTLPEGMAVILPCGWVYIEIGQKFTEGKEIPEEHPYKAWLETYAVPEFRDMVNWWFGILDQAVKDQPDRELERIQDIFIKSCRYEWMFWEMAWNLERWKP
jgi:thiaminase/transcriptional activator TenA